MEGIGSLAPSKYFWYTVIQLIQESPYYNVNNMTILKTTYCCRTRRLSVRSSVRLSVCRLEIISFRGNLISNRPIDRPECPLGGSACPKGVIFRNSNWKHKFAIFFSNIFVCTVLTDLLTRLC